MSSDVINCPPCPQTKTEGEGQGQGREQAVRNVEVSKSLIDFHKNTDDLEKIRTGQTVTISEESIGFEIRLDATDKLNEGDAITEQFGISPQLSTLELMVHPKGGLLEDLSSLLSPITGSSCTKTQNPPMILFIWGRKRVLPVNINSMNITETEFSTDLNPIRATVNVNLTVIEGGGLPYTYTKVMKDAMSILNLANIADIANVIIPG
jgi:hypothetical protein